MKQPTPDADTWLDQVKAGDFSAIPDPFMWDQALLFSQALGNLYRHAKALGIPEPRDSYKARLTDARQAGEWRGSATDLWVVLWYSYNLTMMGLSLPAREDEPFLDKLCLQLRDRLQAIGPDEKATLMKLIEIAWTSQSLSLPETGREEA